MEDANMTTPFLKPRPNVEFRIIDTDEMPPIVITQNEEDQPKVVINMYHKLWISLNRRVIAGIIEGLQEKMDDILTGYLKEQYNFEKEDREFL
mgnify:FL=1|jgi:hypothetical protein|tara:strand:+ start:1235 stop:1513 length:279 start_codon:yes stop_codon:yes gene_type:complete